MSGHGERDLRLELTQDFCIRYKPYTIVSWFGLFEGSSILIALRKGYISRIIDQNSLLKLNIHQYVDSLRLYASIRISLVCKICGYLGDVLLSGSELEIRELSSNYSRLRCIFIGEYTLAKCMNQSLSPSCELSSRKFIWKYCF